MRPIACSVALLLALCLAAPAEAQFRGGRRPVRVDLRFGGGFPGWGFAPSPWWGGGFPPWWGSPWGFDPRFGSPWGWGSPWGGFPPWWGGGFAPSPFGGSQLDIQFGGRRRW